MSRLLINEIPLLVLPSLACEIGLNEAVVLQQIHYWMNGSKNFFEGRHWVYNSVTDWQAQFPFWSESTIKRTLATLEKLELVSTGNFNSDAWDKTKWYSINYDKLDSLSDYADTVTNRTGQNDPIEGIKVTKASGQNDQSPQVKMTRSPTENTTENTTENINPSKSPVGRNDGHVLREKLISLLEGKFDFDKAGELHDAVEAAIVGAGFDCQREYPVADRGDGRRGRVDLLVTGKDGKQCGIEIDRANVRDKSVIKLKQLSDGFILVRDGVITERYEFDGIAVVGAHPATSSVGNISREQLLADAQKALEFYNDCTGTRCRDMKPFMLLLTPTQTRKAYSLEEIRLVIRWVLATWRRRGSGHPKPANICRVNRFDGYLADAETWATISTSIDPEAVIEAYNEIFADILPAATLDNDRRSMIIRLAAYMKNQTTGAFLGYLEKFRNTASDFYFGGESGDGWRASFDYLMKPETLRKTREGAL